MPEFAELIFMGEQKRTLILIVNNDANEAIRLSNQLEHEGYATDITWSGVEALGWLATNSFDLLLVDEYVADIYVEEFLSRASEIQGHPPIVVTQKFPLKDAAAVDGPRFRGYATVYRGDPRLPSAISVALNNNAQRGPDLQGPSRLNLSLN
jgi:CheY-like chemotaxis protein